MKLRLPTIFLVAIWLAVACFSSTVVHLASILLDHATHTVHKMKLKQIIDAVTISEIGPEISTQDQINQRCNMRTLACSR